MIKLQVIGHIKDHEVHTINDKLVTVFRIVYYEGHKIPGKAETINSKVIIKVLDWKNRQFNAGDEVFVDGYLETRPFIRSQFKGVDLLIKSNIITGLIGKLPRYKLVIE
jgi:hypothetical protein